jgi:ribose transport system substrate-binding protein
MAPAWPGSRKVVTEPVHPALVDSGSKDAMNLIAQGGLYRATFLYNPSMSGSAVSVATLIAERKGLSGLLEPEVPSRIQLPATTVTKDNVASAQGLGY